MNPGGRAAVCLVCEHASPAIPASLGTLGLAEADRFSHAVWDPGAGDLARALSNRLDAPLVLARVSRLVIDCNRPPERPDAMPARTETIDIPGNRDLTDAEKAARVREVYDPFHATLSGWLDDFDAPPTLVTIHSFSPTWFGAPRSTEIGLLHDAGDRVARAMLGAAPPGLFAELNRPYSAADGVTHMLARHGTTRGIDNVMIEVRNDLLCSPDAISNVAASLQIMVEAALAKAEAK